MSECLSSFTTDPAGIETRGVPSDVLVKLYEEWGRGGMGVIVTGNIMIDCMNLEAAGNLIIPLNAEWNGDDQRLDQFRRMASGAKALGGVVLGQINHPGRQAQAAIQKHPISASDVQLQMRGIFAKPRPATDQDLDQVVEGFAHAAEYLEKAGYDGVQLHSAHGYLLAQFLSTVTNHRQDIYGGSLENRARLLVRIAREIRKRCAPTFVLGIKINSVEFQGDELTPTEAKQLCHILEREKFDLVEFSGGSYQKLSFTHKQNPGQGKQESTLRREAYFIRFVEMLTPHFSRTRTYITGGLRNAGPMVDALRVVDGVGIARPVCQEPYLARDILAGKINGAKEQHVAEHEFARSAQIARLQMRQIGEGKAPIDMSLEENKDYLKAKPTTGRTSSRQSRI